MKGTVKFFNRMKGFGFITGEDDKDYFVHKSALPEGTDLNDNDEVTFEVVEGDIVTCDDNFTANFRAIAILPVAN